MNIVITEKQADRLSEFFATLAVAEYGGGFLSKESDVNIAFYLGVGTLFLHLSLVIIDRS